MDSAIASVLTEDTKVELPAPVAAAAASAEALSAGLMSKGAGNDEFWLPGGQVRSQRGVVLRLSVTANLTSLAGLASKRV